VLASDVPLDPARASARLMAAARLRRTWGDAYGYGLLAAGRADVMFDPELALWDVAALIPIVEEAGGRITGRRGEPPLHAGSALASNGFLHEEALALIAAG
jgi:fructose-1,6-bisphosphatase/inositol monophosphatase family enzyme